MAVKFVMFKEGKRRDIDVPVGTTMVGRSPDCGVRVPIEAVSRNHCQITVTENSVLVKDLGSSNGTFVNDRRITEQTLRPGDMIRVGTVTFTVQINGKPAQIAAPEEVAAMMGADDSGEIPELMLDDDLSALTEGAADAPAEAGKKDEAGAGFGDLDALDALDMLDLDASDEDITGPAKKKK